jgi:hypothetical protein
MQGGRDMNCKECIHRGKCKMWEDEMDYFKRFNVTPPLYLSRSFKVTEDGASCTYYAQGNKEAKT